MTNTSNGDGGGCARVAAAECDNKHCCVAAEVCEGEGEGEGEGNGRGIKEECFSTQ